MLEKINWVRPKQEVMAAWHLGDTHQGQVIVSKLLYLFSVNLGYSGFYQFGILCRCDGEGHAITRTVDQLHLRNEMKQTVIKQHQNVPIISTVSYLTGQTFWRWPLATESEVVSVHFTWGLQRQLTQRTPAVERRASGTALACANGDNLLFTDYT